MIGIKIKNSVWEKAVLAILKEQGEVWQKNRAYQAVLVQLPPMQLKLFQKKEQAPLICLGKVKGMPYCLEMPFTVSQLQNVLTSLPTIYENDVFVWNMAYRSLLNKKTGKRILLTEKENEIIAFLKKQPQQLASKEELLQNVWQYTLDTDTHTVESTLYTLRQKIKKNPDALIVFTDNGYQLV